MTINAKLLCAVAVSSFAALAATAPAQALTTQECSAKYQAAKAAGTLGGLQIQVTVTPAGEIQLPGIASVFVQCLTLEEARQEIDSRYEAAIPGVHVTLVLSQRAKRFVYVLGEVGQPGRYELVGPTDVIQALSLAGHTSIGANTSCNGRVQPSPT